jgi:hypothetical protein
VGKRRQAAFFFEAPPSAPLFEGSFVYAVLSKEEPMKIRVGAGVIMSVAVALSTSTWSSIAAAEDLSRPARSQLDSSRLTYARLYCTPDNESHFGELTAELAK